MTGIWCPSRHPGRSQVRPGGTGVLLALVLALPVGCDSDGVELGHSASGDASTQPGNGEGPAISVVPDGGGASAATVAVLDTAETARVYLGTDASGRLVVMGLDDAGRVTGFVEPPADSGAVASDALWTPTADDGTHPLSFRSNVAPASNAATTAVPSSVAWQRHAVNAVGGPASGDGDDASGGTGVDDTGAGGAGVDFAFSGETLGTNELVLDISDGASASIDSTGGASVSLGAAGSGNGGEQVIALAADQLVGTWRSRSLTCNSDASHCNAWQLRLQLEPGAADGSLGMSGEARLEITDSAANATATVPVLHESALSGVLRQHGRFSVGVSMTWNTYRYDGYAFVLHDRPTELRMLVSTDSELADQQVLVLSLERASGNS